MGVWGDKPHEERKKSFDAEKKGRGTKAKNNDNKVKTEVFY